jgi:hypothetical protein
MIGGAAMTKRIRSTDVRRLTRRFVGVALLAFSMAVAGAAKAAECWQGWGYYVEPKTLAFKSGQTLYVTDGPMNWNRQEWVKLYPIDPKTGKRDRKREPVVVRPSRPSKQGGGKWGDVVEDVAEVLGSRWSMLVRLSHVKPSPHSMSLNDEYSRWACGLD